MSLSAVLERVREARAALEEAEAEILAVQAAEAPKAPKVQPTPLPPPAPAAEAPRGLSDPKAFFDHVRKHPPLGPVLSGDEVAGCERILAACAAERFPASWAAYVLATAAHETGGAMVPNVENLNYTTAERIRAVWPSRFPTVASAEPFVRNAKGLANHVYNGRMGNRAGSNDGWDFRGRGQAHITGREMYAKLDAELDLGGELVRNPDLALRPDISARILVVGMVKGLFTGKSLNDYIAARPTTQQFVNARKIVNPDKNGPRIAAMAEVFFAALDAGGWR